MVIELAINYWSEGVLCFDPEKVLAKFAKAFPSLVVDPTDWAEREVEQVARDIQSLQLADETRQVMLRQIKGKARRNGPVFTFRWMTDNGTTVEGHVSRYSMWIRMSAEIAPTYQATIVNVFKSFGAGEIQISESRAPE